MGAKQQDNEFNGQPFPGTGGDFVDGNDVEGHRIPYKAAGDGNAPETPGGAEDDVEGHRVPRLGPQDAIAREDGQEVSRRWSGAEDDGGDDVEGHLYRNLPTTQGEIARRGPGDNPHGER